MPCQSLDYVIERNISFGDLQFSGAIGITQLRFLSFITLWNTKTNSLLLTFIILLGNTETDLANCFTSNDAPYYLGTFSSFFVQRSLLNVFCSKRIPRPTTGLLWNWDFPLNYSSPFQKEELRPISFLQQVPWVNADCQCSRGAPCSLGV